MLKIIKKYKYIITFVLVLVIILLVIVRKNMLKDNNKKYAVYKSEVVSADIPLEEESEVLIEEEKGEEDAEEKEKVRVDIKGQVVNPGVYEVSDNARVIDVVNAAGGLTDIANTSLINLSKRVEDQMVIIIYSHEEVLNSNVKEIETVFKIIEKECVCPNIKNDSCINTELDKEENNNNKETDNEIDNNTESEKDNKLVNINNASKEELMTISGIGESKAKSIIEYRENNKFNVIEDIKNVSGIGDALFEKIKEYITV